MEQDAPLRVLGAYGSPYTRKLVALLRYRRIPHRVLWGDASHPPAGLPAPRPALLPVCYFPVAGAAPDAVVDSTPIIRRLEREHAARSALPADPALAFLASLLEDFADEWLSKAMFHYRWFHAWDAAHAAALIPLWYETRMPEAQWRERGGQFAARQQSRLDLVGGGAGNAATIEDSFGRVIDALDGALTRHRFLFGERPSVADFAFFGQLSQLLRVDPTPADLGWARAPRVGAWVDLMEDWSGLEPVETDWIARDEAPGQLGALLAEAGRVYVPFMLANARALAGGEPRFRCTLDGAAWQQPAFPYQAKCLARLREEHAVLADADRGAVEGIVAGSGCAALWTAPG